MASIMEIMQLCRLCLVKDQANVPIFQEQGDIRQIFLKITACLPIKVSKDDSLPKKICDRCLYKLELLYQFWNTTANAEKQLLTWLSQAGIEGDSKTTQEAMAIALQSQISTHSVKEEELDPPEIVPETTDDLPTEAESFVLQPPQLPFEPAGIQFESPPEIGESQGESRLQDDGEAGGDDDEDEDDDDNGAMNEDEQEEEPEEDDDPEPPPPKRSRRQAAIKAAQLVSLKAKDEDDEEEEKEDEEDEEDVDDPTVTVPKTEEESENSETEDNSENPLPTDFVSLGTAGDEDQPGPSGVGKTEAPIPRTPQKLILLPLNLPQSNQTGPNLKFVRVLPQATKTNQAGSSIKFLRVLPQTLTFPTSVTTTPTLTFPMSVATTPTLTFPTNVATTPSKQVTFVVDNRTVAKPGGVPIIKNLILNSDFLRCKGNPIQKLTLLSLPQNVAACPTLVKPVQDPLRPPKLYTCKRCNQSFPSKGKREIHKYHAHKSKRFACDLCPMTFYTPLPLRKHKLSHVAGKQFRCDACGKLFKQKTGLDLHMRGHNGQLPHGCQQCDRKFLYVSTLKQHVDNCHVIKEKLTCETCHKQFSSVGNLKVHAKQHDPNRKLLTYKCKDCGVEYHSRHGYRLHLKKHKGGVDYICDECGKSLSTAISLKDHKRRHRNEKPVQCHDCGKCFTNKALLRIHVRVHTKEKPFQCDTCGKSFTQKGSLTIHIKSVHTGEKAHSCNVCGKSFTTTTMLKAHSKRHGISFS